MSLRKAKQRILSRYKLSENSFVLGYASFFGLTIHSLKETADNIAGQTVGASLKGDAEVVADDFNKVFRREIGSICNVEQE